VKNCHPLYTWFACNSVSCVLFVSVTVSLFTGSLLHELSNDGARQQFNSFLDDLILPQMVSSAQVMDQSVKTVM